MPVIDAPTRHDWPILAIGQQRFGHFVLLRLDPLASVAILDDDEASSAAAHLPQDWFLGIIATTGGLERLNERGRPSLNLNIHLVGVGPSEPVSAAIPISPALQINDDHPPIQVPFDLPWPNLYAHSYLTVTAVITRIHAGPDYFPDPLSDEQLAALLEMASKDRYHRHDATFEALLKKLAEEQPDDPPPGDSDAGSDCESDSGSQDDFMLSEEAQLITARYQSRHLCVELWLDPASCPGQPAPPTACAEVVNGLKAIMEEWYDRKLEELKSRRPQLIKEWTQRVKEAAVGEGEERVRAQDPVPAEDDIRPEDAVDYRVEQHEDPERPSRSLEEFSPGAAPASSEPAQIPAADEIADTSPAPQNLSRTPGGSTEAAIIKVSNTGPELQDRPHGAKPAPPTGADKQVSPKHVLAKGAATVRDRLASMKHAAVKSLHSVLARVKARKGRGASSS